MGGGRPAAGGASDGWVDGGSRALGAGEGDAGRAVPVERHKRPEGPVVGSETSRCLLEARAVSPSQSPGSRKAVAIQGGSSAAFIARVEAELRRRRDAGAGACAAC